MLYQHVLIIIDNAVALLIVEPALHHYRRRR